jgi:hypothetical protein
LKTIPHKGSSDDSDISTVQTFGPQS